MNPNGYGFENFVPPAGLSTTGTPAANAALNYGAHSAMFPPSMWSLPGPSPTAGGSQPRPGQIDLGVPNGSHHPYFNTQAFPSTALYPTMSGSIYDTSMYLGEASASLSTPVGHTQMGSLGLTSAHNRPSNTDKPTTKIYSNNTSGIASSTQDGHTISQHAAAAQIPDKGQQPGSSTQQSMHNAGVPNPMQWGHAAYQSRQHLSQPTIEEIQAWQQYFRQHQLSSFYGPNTISPQEQALQQAHLAAQMGRFSHLPYNMISASQFQVPHSHNPGLRSRQASADMSDRMPNPAHHPTSTLDPTSQLAYNLPPTQIPFANQASYGQPLAPSGEGAGWTASSPDAMVAASADPRSSNSRHESSPVTNKRGRGRRAAPAPRKAAADSEDDEAEGSEDGADAEAEEDEVGRRKKKQYSWSELAASLEPVTGLATIDKILDDRLDNPSGSLGQERRLFYVKWRGRAHIYNTWDSYENLRGFKGSKKLDNYIKNMNKTAQLKLEATPEDIEAYEVGRELEREMIEQHTKPDRVVSCRTTETGETQYLIKWCKLQYNEATWEPSERVKDYEAPLKKFHLREQQAPLCAKYYLSVSRNHPTQRDLKQLNTTRPGFLTGELRDYQVQGVNWLIYSWVNHTNCILADEMGLGKTIQAIAFLGFLQYVQSIPGPFLVVVPLSTLPNWEAEFEKWLPECNVVVYAGDGKSRAIIRQYEMFSAEANNAPKFHVLLTTFEIILKDRDYLSQINWELLVVDEAHRLKNAESALHDVLDGFTTRCRMLITGTPLQNSLKELWALMHFIEPVKFPSLAFFEQKYGQLSHEAQIGQLHSELKPHLLRRLKRDVEKSLPEKNEKILRVPLSALQRQYYRWVLTRNFKELNKGLSGQSATTLSNIMIELKKVCNHPYLFSNAEESHGKAMYPDLSPPEALIANSGKMILLDQLLRRLHSTGHRVLIFSQMVRMLDLIGDFVRFRGYAFQRLDGSSTRIQRQRAMESFNAPNSRDFCFLLSTRAGGLGINLSTADTVIIFDSDWNPQNDLQAEARAHRIGQKNVVSIYRLVSRNTVEENILARAKKKLALDQLVIQRLNATSEQSDAKEPKPVLLSGASMGSQWQKSELADVIRFGAQEIFKSENDKVAELELRTMDMDAILNTSEDAADQAEPEASDMMGNFRFSEFKLNPSNSSSSSSTPILSQSGSGADGFWEGVVPAEAREEIVQPTEEPLGPRRARQKSKNFDMSPGRRQVAPDMEPPAAKRAKLGDEQDEAPTEEPREAANDTFSTKFTGGYGASLDGKQIKKLVAAMKSVGDLTRIAAVSQSAGLDSTKSLEDIYAIVCELIAECRKAAQAGNEKKRILLFYQGVEVNVTLLLSRLDDFQLLKSLLYDAADPMAVLVPLLADVKPWKLGARSSWKSPSDDARLLVGIYFHGCGSLETLAKDQHLGLTNVLTGNAGKLQLSQLLSRFESLMRSIRNSKASVVAVNHAVPAALAAPQEAASYPSAPAAAPDTAQFQDFAPYASWDPAYQMADAQTSSTSSSLVPTHQQFEQHQQHQQQSIHSRYLVEHLLNSTDTPAPLSYTPEQPHVQQQQHHGHHQHHQHHQH
eukprot:TRINITY_DN4881_c0_g1_i1.p1 TRINITY_DN4881_c0_g1~~TRINITY_DN4881_c0_g1_i1.p1  ORF type:complete len:1587 (+),score=273.57 TRINITY_DN4881_c0_g1_i1:309-5069(+)